MKRRQLDLRSADEVIAEIDRLRSLGYTRTKNWNLTQICEHLNQTMCGGMDGFGFRFPWILRATLMRWIFRYALKKRFLLSGSPTLPVLKPKAEGTEDDPAVIDTCIQTLRRAEAFEGPIENYPLLNEISVQDWKEFMWLHAGHHLSFLVPDAERSAADTS